MLGKYGIGARCTDTTEEAYGYAALIGNAPVPKGYVVVNGVDVEKGKVVECGNVLE
jgi:hypothetical protein